MSRTKHHNAPKRSLLFKLPDRYTGWLGEGATTTAFRKRIEHHAGRRWGRKMVERDVQDALFGKDVPLPFERQHIHNDNKLYTPQQPALPPIRWKRSILNRSK